MEKRGLVANGRDELETDEEGRRQYRREVQYDADFFTSTKVVQAFSRGCVVPSRVTNAAKDSMEVEILEPGQCEAHQGARKDEPQDEVVAFFEADGMVHFSHGAEKRGFMLFY